MHFGIVFAIMQSFFMYTIYSMDGTSMIGLQLSSLLYLYWW